MALPQTIQEINEKQPNLKIKCSLCSEEIGLFWSKCGLPYWLHNHDNCKDIYPDTIEMAKIAKDLLYEYMEDIGYLTLETQCKQCKCISLDYPRSKLTFKKDYLHMYNINSDDKSSILRNNSNVTNLEDCFNEMFDISAIDLEGNNIYNINIWKLHQDYDSENSNYFCLDAKQILSKLSGKRAQYRKHKRRELKLINYRKMSSCERKFCIPLRSLARKLGYLEIKLPYLCKALQLIDEANNGTYIKEILVWNTSGRTIFDGPIEKLKYNGLWNSFKQREACLRCERYNPDVHNGKAFCNDCVKAINKMNVSIFNDTNVFKLSNSVLYPNPMFGNLVYDRHFSDPLPRNSLVTSPLMLERQKSTPVRDNKILSREKDERKENLLTNNVRNSKDDLIKLNIDPLGRQVSESNYGDISINTTRKIEYIKVITNEKRRLSLDEGLNWLNFVSNKTDDSLPCLICKRSYNTSSENMFLERFYVNGKVQNYVIWNNAKKQCCVVCLNDRMRASGLL